MNPSIFTTHANINMIKFRRHTIRLNLKTGELNIDRRKYPQHRAIEYSPLEECPSTNRILLNAFSMCNEPLEVRRHFWEFLGYMMLSDRPILHNFILFGDPRSEKTTIMNALRPILNPWSVKNKLELKHRYPSKPHPDDEIIQNTVIPFHNFRRMLDTEHEEMTRTIQNELPAIAARAISAARVLAMRGQFVVPLDCQEATMDYMRNVDHVGEFLRQCMIVHRNLNVKAHTVKVFRAYREWSKRRPSRCSVERFNRELRSRRIEREKDTGGLSRLEGLSFV